MIQIDDAGSGSLVGGTYIGLLRIETGEHYFGIIPLKFYNECNFKKKLYLQYACKIVDDGIKKIKLGDREKVQICQGYMFDEVRKYLSVNNIDFDSVKIGEPLQTIIEKAFENYTISLGLPDNFIKYTKYPFHFHRLLRWVYADYYNRKKLCKTGWKSWQKYGHLNVEKYSDILYNKNYYCLKCGRKILQASPVNVIKYFSNMPNTIYIHKRCPQVFLNP